jgi:hypothetical protein
MKNKILVAITGHGEPNYQHKLEIVKKNLTIITSTAPSDSNGVPIYDLEVVIFSYDDSIRDLDYKEFEDILTIKKVNGFCGEHIYNHLKPELVEKYEHFIMMLDDILLSSDFNLSYFLELKKIHDIDIISPCLSLDSKLNHKAIVHKPELSKTLRIVRVLEWFVYIFSKKDGEHSIYKKYHSVFDETTSTMWGIDACLHACLDMKLGIVNHITMKHYYHGCSAGGTLEWNLLNDKIYKKYNKTNLSGRNFKEYVSNHNEITRLPLNV